MANWNPFAKREDFTKNHLIAYKVLTIVSWLLLVIVGAYYTFSRPADCGHKHVCHTIWGQNSHRRTPFSLNSVVTSIYWVVILILQAHYVRYLWSTDKAFITSAANVGSHFIFHNLLTFGFIMLWVRGHFWQGELLLIVNLFNLTLLYFGHPTTPLFIHLPVVSAPLAWNYVAILWDGAAMVNAHTLPARIVANIFIWGILVLGGFFLLTFKDYTMGLELAVLSLALAIGQIGTHVIALQWIFAFVIAGCLLVMSLLIGAPKLFGQDRSIRQEGAIVSEDRERAPLLADQ
ncbi:hypothetical protein LTR99_000404 [Exophiala xenobiotica]|uniref:DUF1774-domain-containing protein n=1 Tax=Vermiconidia calcicola TaxID=1690605 RepID=A0AAV9QKA4_9PEZI|nr:hypothetical protein H2202_004764 [Exophiala xenobiotica]KAK5543768.1 hypothetical protein LTR25_001383 [Vermiconidia calcicola]KAK5548446.1 hypothetical protein LTR23_001576 [Chaetothyriales sp. CCFEE 6169]KAK5197237.1 hypothetical protein LTR92_003176 [Exophiala xenobiotica]KAK5213608.1 hypothetical protein LTR41_001188 [Exophiala xenobiotica]